MIKPNAYLNIGKIVSIAENNFNLSNLKMSKMDRYAAEGI